MAAFGKSTSNGLGEEHRRFPGEDRLPGHLGQGRDPGEGPILFETEFVERFLQDRPLIERQPINHEKSNLVADALRALASKVPEEIGLTTL